MLEKFGVNLSENLEEIIIEDARGEIAVLYNPDKVGIRFLEGDFLIVYGETLGITDVQRTNVYGAEKMEKMPQIKLHYFQQ